jgi:hypothetical protein
MSTCFVWLVLIGGGVFVMASLLRWFEQTADAVDHNEWNKLALLIVFPFAAWFYPSRYVAGRPTAVPHHEPVRGFGKIPSAKTQAAKMDQPPAGTPPEFMGMPVVPPKKPKAPIDPEKLAKLKQKMREQGMLDE